MQYLDNEDARRILAPKLAEIDAMKGQLEEARADTDPFALNEARRLERDIREAEAQFWESYAGALLDDYTHHARTLVYRYLHPLRALGNKGNGPARLAAGAVEEIAAWEGANKRPLWPTYDACDIQGEAVSEDDLLLKLKADLRAAPGA